MMWIRGLRTREKGQSRGKEKRTGGTRMEDTKGLGNKNGKRRLSDVGDSDESVGEKESFGWNGG